MLSPTVYKNVISCFLKVQTFFKHISIGFYFGAVITMIMISLSLVSIFWTPHDVLKLDIAQRFQTMSWQYWLGTDYLGRDLFSMLMRGGFNSIWVAFLATCLGVVVGVPLGAVVAMSQSQWGEFVMRANDFIFAFPSLIIAVMLTAVFGHSAFNAVIAIGVFAIPVFARVTRGAALVILKQEFVTYSFAIGNSKMHTFWRHVLPNIVSLIIVQVTLQFSFGILAESALSYIGLGIQPPEVSWGKMLNESQTMMRLAPQLAIYPGLAMILTVLGLNLMGDGLRDFFDPRMSKHVNKII